MKIIISKRNLSDGIDKLEGRCLRVAKYLNKRYNNQFTPELRIGAKNEKNFLILK